MKQLLQVAIDAHGGLEQWKRVQQVSANFTASGLGFTQWGSVAEQFTQQPLRVTVDTREPKTVLEPFIIPGQRGVYRPNRTIVEALDGAPLEELDNPRDSLHTLAPGTPWRATQVLYFVGYSLWMYFTLPYSFLADGVECEEIESWSEDHGTWRALKVTYPPTYHSHSTEQIHYFDHQGLMRRQDYTVGGVKAAHYLDGHQKFDGLIFPTQRRIYPQGPNGTPNRRQLLISADLSDYEIIRATG